MLEEERPCFAWIPAQTMLEMHNGLEEMRDNSVGVVGDNYWKP